MHQFYKTGKLFIVLIMSLALLACSKVTQENFNKIKTNMTMKEVISILGEPTSSDSVNIAGISGTSAIWKEKEAEIDIQFLNDKVTVKTFSKSGDSNNSDQKHP